MLLKECPHFIVSVISDDSEEFGSRNFSGQWKKESELVGMAGRVDFTF